MDQKFPDQQFPQFYSDGGPRGEVLGHCRTLGSYGRLLEISCEAVQCGSDRTAEFQFLPQHKVEGERWTAVEPMVTPLLPPNTGSKVFPGPSVGPEDIPEQMQYFYVHRHMDSFSTMGELLGPHFRFGKSVRRRKDDAAGLVRLQDFIDSLKYKKCERGTRSERVDRYHSMLGGVLPDVPPDLLHELLHEELTHQRSTEHLQPAFTGGALAVLRPQGEQNHACLVYPGGGALSSINFHKVVLPYSEDTLPTVEVLDQPLTWKLNGSVRQVGVARVDDEAYLGLRSDHFCAAWGVRGGEDPLALEVVQLKEPSTCINVSPHVAGELLVAVESGAAYLWTVGTGLQKIRVEQSNLYFNAASPWRWCEFTAHPRVMVYADRTGVDLTDIRSGGSSHTLFRIGSAAGCVNGETVVLSRYLGESHAHHHLITTQFSAYILDERMPCVPSLKWGHMMEAPPCFCHVVPAPAPDSTSKILLGSQRAQETVLLQYTGGRALPCQSCGAVQKLCSPCESLKPEEQLPHHHHEAQTRLSAPAAGLAVTQQNGFLCVFQLTEAGDMFYQVLKHHDSEPSGEPTFRTSSDVRGSGDSTQDGVSAGPAAVSGSTPSVPEQASAELMVIWRAWLKRLLKTTPRNPLRHRRIKSSAVIRLKVQQQRRFGRLRRHLRETMRSRKVLTHALTNLLPLSVTPVPDTVNPADWTDELSQRLDVSWEDGWQNWWEEKLGLNKEAKIRSLQRRRRQEKRARSRRRVALSGSFTSSVSYQDDLSEWSLDASQSLGSDAESVSASQNADGLQSDPDGHDASIGTAPSPGHQPPEGTVSNQSPPPSRKQERPPGGASAANQDPKASPRKSVPVSPYVRLRLLESEHLGSREPSQNVPEGGAEESSLSQISNFSFTSQFRNPTRAPPPQRKRSRMGF